MNYLKLVKNIKKKKYSNYLNLKKDFFDSYFQSRFELLYKIENLKKKKITFKKKLLNQGKFKKINTFLFFFKTYQKYIKNRKLSKNDKKIIFSFYKKYESNLNLKKEYNYKLKKLVQKETEIYSYILLAFFLKFLNKIDNFQKLNCLIKLNDDIILNKSKIKDKYFYKLFIENIKLEIMWVKKIK